jgi:hypothetical protein
MNFKLLHIFTRSSGACILALLVFSMVGCATGNRAQENMAAKVRSAPTCCESMRQFPFADLALGKTEIEIDEKAPAFIFESGKSLFRAYSLPKPNGVLKVTLRSYTNAAVGGLFQPDILLLDNNFQVSRLIAKPLFGLPLISEQAFSPAYSSYDFVIESDRNRFKYLVVRTTDELLIINTPVNESSTVPVGGAFVRFATTGRIVGRPMGYLTVNVSLSPTQRQ